MHKGRLYIFDARQVWHEPIIAEAQRRGWKAERIHNVHQLGEGYGFFRPHPAYLAEHQIIYNQMAERLTMIQDRAQVEVYDDKVQQLRWEHLMPNTWYIGDRSYGNIEDLPLPLMSKAKEGASSVNVRFIKTREQLRKHAEAIFGEGIEVSYCAGGLKTVQQGYLLLQEFIPHDVTWRVFRIGDQYAVFKRFCYPDKPMAQTGNVEAVEKRDSLVDDLIEYARRVTEEIGTKFVALDILRSGSKWKLIETSLAFPTVAGRGDNARFCKGKRWTQVWSVMFDEVEAGAWG